MVEKKPLAALCSAGISPDIHRNNVSVSAVLTLDLTLLRSVEINVCMFGLAESNERYNSSKNISVQ